MTALYIILGLILLITVILSVRFKIHFEYDRIVTCYAKWLFIKIPVLTGEESNKDSSETNEVTENKDNNVHTSSEVKNEDKPLNEDTDENAVYDFEEETVVDDKTENNNTDEKNKTQEVINQPLTVKNDIEKTGTVSESAVSDIKEDSEKKAEPDKSQKNNENQNKKTDEPKPNSLTDFKSIFTTFYDNTGVDGVIELLSRLFSALNNYSRRSVHWFIMDELYVDAVIAKSDAAETAIAYGKYCSVIFPLFGNLIARFNVKKYDIDISTDYLAGKGNARVSFTLSIVPRKIINSTVILVYDLIVRFLMKLYKHGRVPENNDNNKT